MASSSESESEPSQSLSASPEIKDESPIQKTPSYQKSNTKGKGRINGKKPVLSNRPKKRKLVRWNDDLDKEVLLTMQWACTESGIKIPWGMIAAQIGKDVSEGALIQHLSKLRSSMMKAKIDVPPPLRRGIPTKEPSKIYAPAGTKRKAGPFEGAVSITPTNQKTQTRIKSKSGGRSKGKRNMSDEEDSDEQPEAPYLLSDSDEEYGSRKKKRVRASRANPNTPDFNVGTPTTTTKRRISAIQGDSIDIDVKESFEAADIGPAGRTRGVKQDFSAVLAEEAELSNEEEEEEEYGNSDDEEEIAVLRYVSPGGDSGIDNHTDEGPRQAGPFSFTEENAKAIELELSRSQFAVPAGSLRMAGGGQAPTWTSRIPTETFNPGYMFPDSHLSSGVHSYPNMFAHGYNVLLPVRRNYRPFSAQSGVSTRTASSASYLDFDEFNAAAIQAPAGETQTFNSGFSMLMSGANYNDGFHGMTDSPDMFADTTEAGVEQVDTE